MNGEAPPAEAELVPPAELVLRQSSDLFVADDPLVARALRLIAENSPTLRRVQEVAAAVAVNRRTLERRFRASVGRTVAEEMTRLRLNRTKRRLVETDLPLKSVALDAGFRTANHFSKVFTRVEGMTPTAYRRERQRVQTERQPNAG
jgi:LacI family transcriptional regulator